jgi:hypothetical protein
MFNDFNESEYTHNERAERAFDAEERVYRRERHDDDAIEGRAENAAAAPATIAIGGWFTTPRPAMPGYAQIANGIYVRTAAPKRSAAARYHAETLAIEADARRIARVRRELIAELKEIA